MSSQETLNWRTSSQNTKDEWRVVLRGDIVRDDSRELRCIYGARRFGVADDDGKSFGRYFKITLAVLDKQVMP